MEGGVEVMRRKAVTVANLAKTTSRTITITTKLH